MTPAAQLIGQLMEEGVDAGELIEALHDEGWQFIHGPREERWKDRQDNEVFAIIGSVNNVAVVAKRTITARALAHMPLAGVNSVWESLRSEYSERLYNLLYGLS